MRLCDDENGMEREVELWREKNFFERNPRDQGECEDDSRMRCVFGGEIERVNPEDFCGEGEKSWFKDLRELTDRIQRMSLSWQPRSLCGKFPPLL
ncbi:aluminum-activated malate transporter 14-like protein [Corchorus olitorius]|uniref:Aluminum-activated malate transporter 14-like protein n=1 Tax=Corchorus olitorius TaxID=93759 RepID=A0A1R3JVJ3_9ROSI|nr:aluminum-activated malate transporter 14-like protein [Corchorus olitorius]